MADPFITCPNCLSQIQLTEAFTREVREKYRREFEDRVSRSEQDFRELFKNKERELQERLAKERSKLEADARMQAEAALSLEFKGLRNQLEDRSRELQDAKERELVLRKQRSELEERERNVQLEVARLLDEERKKIWETASARSADEHRLKDLEKEKQLSDMRRQIEELKRKAEQGSQQTQGEVMELELEEALRFHFPLDQIDAVAKGFRGADLLQAVHNTRGQHSGTILWESKQAKTWCENWVQKLKDDQREAKADLAVLVTSTLPKEIKRLGCVDGVFVVDLSCVIGIATALRANLIQLGDARRALVGQNDKMELVYRYLSGAEFKQRVQGIIESFLALKEDLEAEKRAMERIWAKREKQIHRAVINTTGMYGDLQGIIGASLPEIRELELPSSDAPWRSLTA